MANTLLANAIDIRRWLEADAESTYEDRVTRDREIGRTLESGNDVDRVLGWWEQVVSRVDPDFSPQQAPLQGSGARVAVLARLATTLLTGIGVVLGIGLGTLAFAYDGQYPVNVLALLGVLVGVPLVMLLFTLIFLLPGSLPGFGTIREGVSVINPGRWVGAWLDRYARLDLYAGFGAASGPFARWQLTVFSQWLAAGYFIGVLSAGAVLVTVTDLAFGWSSTLNLDADSVHRLFTFVSWPWQGWFPAAAPDAALVEASRYFRLESADIDAGRAAALGAWWPFVLMTILSWGLLPRLLLLFLGRWRLETAVRSMLCQDPEVLALLDRLTPPRVDFGLEASEEALATQAELPEPPTLEWDDRTGLLIWNEALQIDQARVWLQANLGTGGGRALALGVRSVDGIAEELAGFPTDLPRVVVFCKGWEPPLLEFADFLQALRAQVGDQATLVIVPINTRRSGVDAADREIWAEFLGRHGGARLYVLQETSTQEAAG